MRVNPNVLPDLPLDQIANGTYRDPKTGISCLVVDGERYDLAPLDFDQDFKAIEDEVVKRRKDPTQTIKDVFSSLGDNPELKQAFVKEAWNDSRRTEAQDKPSDDEIRHFLSTREGILWSLQYQFRKMNKGVDEAKMHAIINAVTHGELEKMMKLQLDANPVLREIGDTLEKHGVTGDKILEASD